MNGAGATGTLPLHVRETVYSAHTKVRKLVGLRRLKQSSESLDVQGEQILVLDQVIDLEAVWGDGTLGLATLCTSDDDVRHVEGVLEWCKELR